MEVFDLQPEVFSIQLAFRVVDLQWQEMVKDLNLIMKHGAQGGEDSSLRVYLSGMQDQLKLVEKHAAELARLVREPSE